MPSIQDHELRIRNRPRIVVVDSEPASARQTLATLTAAGYDCKSFVECDSAWPSCQENGADVDGHRIFQREASTTEFDSQSQDAFAGNCGGPDGGESGGVNGGRGDASWRFRLSHQADQHR